MNSEQTPARKWHIGDDPDSLPESAIDRADAINDLYRRYEGIRPVVVSGFALAGIVLLLALPALGVQIPEFILSLAVLALLFMSGGSVRDTRRALDYLKPYVDQDPELKNGFDILAGRKAHPRQVSPDETR